MNYSLIALIVIVVILSAWMMHGSATSSEGLNSITPVGDADGCVNGVCSVSPKKKKIKTD